MSTDPREASAESPPNLPRAASQPADPSSAGASAVGEVPAHVETSFGPHVASLLGRYVDMLAGIGFERGLIGPREVPRLWVRHILNCAVIAPLFPHGSTVADVGSGAGLPGVVLAIVRPDLRVTLVESLKRRVAFLDEVKARLGLENLAIQRTRAEDYSGPRFDAVTARAVAPLDRLAAWTLPLLKPGGQLVAIKGARAHDEAARHVGRIRELGGEDLTVVEMGRGLVDPPVTIVRVTAGRVHPARRRP